MKLEIYEKRRISMELSCRHVHSHSLKCRANTASGGRHRPARHKGTIGPGIFFLGYFFFEIPSNVVLHKVGARKSPRTSGTSAGGT